MHRAICVYSASSDAIAPHYFAAAERLGELLARRGVTLIYGGGKVGLMGAVATSVHRHGGRVVGVIPEHLRTVELSYELSDELIVTRDMRERKAVMEARSDAFVTLPGGFGTLEEVLEVLTLKQLRRHTKPIVFLNTANFFDPLLAVFEQLYRERFTKESHRHTYHVAAQPEDVFEFLANHQPVPVEPKWF